MLRMTNVTILLKTLKKKILKKNFYFLKKFFNEKLKNFN